MIKPQLWAGLMAVLLAASCNEVIDQNKEVESNEPDETSILPYNSDSLSGKVIDGYISGATVFLDLNFNGEKDSDEPSAVSTNRGDYSLSLNSAHQSCVGLVPVVVDVPVGAIDEDLGMVQSAYRMVLPPSFHNQQTNLPFDITPITSVLWSVLQQKIENDASLSCDVLKAQPSKRESLVALLDEALDHVVYHYNVSRQQIFSDFIAAGDQDAQQRAQTIVKGLQRSLIETLALQSEYPDAWLAKVSFHRSDYRDDGEDQYIDSWYRDTVVIAPRYRFGHLEKMTDDLTTPVRTIIYSEDASWHMDNLFVAEVKEIESRGGDDSPYYCEHVERISFDVGNKSYEINNRVNGTEEDMVESFEDCMIENFAKDTDERYVFVTDRSDSVFEYTAQYFFTRPADGFTLLDDVMDLSDNEFQIDRNAVANALESLPYGYNDDSDSGADWWVKTKRYTDNEGNDVSISHGTFDELFKKYTVYVDGTHDEVCSLDESTWVECDEFISP